MPPHGTWSTTDNNVPLEGGELTTSYASCRVRRDASRAVSRSKESYALVITMRSQHLCIETKYTSSLGECEMTRSPKPRFRLDGTDTRRKSLVFKNLHFAVSECWRAWLRPVGNVARKTSSTDILTLLPWKAPELYWDGKSGCTHLLTAHFVHWHQANHIFGRV